MSKKKTEMTWELRQMLSPDIHDAWDTLSAEVQGMIATVAQFAFDAGKSEAYDNSYDSYGGDYECTREHVDDK